MRVYLAEAGGIWLHDSAPCRWWAPLLIATVCELRACAHSPDSNKQLLPPEVG